MNIEFPCLNPNHDFQTDKDLMRDVMKGWIDGIDPVKAYCPMCKKNNDLGQRDLIMPRADVLALMIENYFRKQPITLKVI